jgi:hypothetical protein
LSHLHDEVGAQRALRLGWPGTRRTEHRPLPAKRKYLLMDVVEIRMGSGERIADPDDLTVHSLVENWHTRDTHLAAYRVITSESTESLTAVGPSMDIERSFDRSSVERVPYEPS